MQTSWIRIPIVFALASVVVAPEQSHSSDAELTERFQEAFAAGYCVSEVLDQANVSLSRCESVWRAPVSSCAGKIGLFEYVTSTELTDEEWAAQLDVAAYDLTVCLFALLGAGATERDNPDRAIFQAIMDYDDKLRELEEISPE